MQPFQSSTILTMPPLPVLTPKPTSARSATIGRLMKHGERAVRHFLGVVLADRTTRNIFYFLGLNLAFSFVELFVGYFSNSLSLLSDGVHMLFDCSAIVMNLVAAVIVKWPPSKHYSFGYAE